MILKEGTYETGTVVIERRFSNWAVFRAEVPYKTRIVSRYFLIYEAAMVQVRGLEILHPTSGAAPLVTHVSRSTDVLLTDNIIHDSYDNDLLKINEGSSRVSVVGNIFYNQDQLGHANHIDVNGAKDVTIRGNIFFNDYVGSGRVSLLGAGSVIVVKNSGLVPESRRTTIAGNVFLNYQGGVGKNFILFGEDGHPNHETQEAVIENNLMLGNSPERIRSPFGLKGVRNIVYRHNTVSGDMPASAFAMRLNREGDNQANLNVAMHNNIWTSPNRTMNVFSNGEHDESINAVLLNNLYWNGGAALPQTEGVFNPSDDPLAIVGDPGIPLPLNIILPRLTSGRFESGSSSILQELDRLAKAYGKPIEGAMLSRSAAAEVPAVDLLGRARVGFGSSLGAVEFGAEGAVPPLRLWLERNRIAGGVGTLANLVDIAVEAPPNGAIVTLSSSRPDLVVIPSSVTIPAGDTFATFSIRTTAVSVATPVTITASGQQVSRSLALTLTPVEIATVNPTPEWMIGSTSTTNNRVYLTGPAPARGLTISLSTSDRKVTVPRSLKVAAGLEFTEPFTIVSSITDVSSVVAITAAVNGSTGSADLAVRTTSFALTLNPWAIVNGGKVTGTVQLPFVAPTGGVSVALTTPRPDLISIPSQVTVKKGASRGTFEILGAAAISTRLQVPIVASYGTSSAQQDLTVIPLTVDAFNAPATVMVGSSVTVGFAINSPPPSDLTINLVGTGVKVPASVVVPADSWVGYFTVTADQTATPGTATIKLSVLGKEIGQMSIVVTSIALTGVYVNPTTAPPGSSMRADLGGTAPAGGVQLSVSSSDTAIAVPASVTVPQGSSSVSIPLTVASLTAPRFVTLTVSQGSVVRTITTEVLANSVSELTFSPMTVSSGSSTTGEVRLRHGVSAPVTITLTSSNPQALAIPSSVTIPAGTLLVRFTTSVAALVTSPTPVQISAAFGSSRVSSEVQITPPTISSVNPYPTAIVGGLGADGGSAVFMVAAVPVDVVVSLASSDPSVLAMPATVTVPAGADRARFGFQTTAVTKTQNITITATAGGQSKSATVSVTPN